MISLLLQERRRRKLIPIVALALAALYLFVVLPLGRRADKLDEPLNQAWRKLSSALNQTNNLALDFVGITNQLEVTRQALAALGTARKQAMFRTMVAEPLREHLSAPFQLVDYENARGKQQDDLRKLAAQNKITVTPAVFEGYPAHTADVKQPALLWAQLALVEDLLTAAVQCRVSTIQSLHVPPVLTNAPPPAGSRTLAELPVQLELIGDASSLGSFLRRIPLRIEELPSAGLPEGATNKPALFIDRLVLRKQTPARPEEVAASLRVVGFVFRD